MSTLIPPVVITGTWLIAQSTWDQYDWLEQPISDLAADDAPTQLWVSIAFLIGGTANIVTGVYARSFNMAARIAFVLNGLFTYGLTYFTTPTQTTSSEEHRLFAISAFAISSIWPILATRFDKRYSILIRPLGTIAATIVLLVMTTGLLVVWVADDAQGIGLYQRIVGVSQGLWPLIVVWWSYFHEKRLTQDVLGGESGISKRTKDNYVS
ncbi:MAG TPA: DUF998 domain-containing protein [Microbacteriaceae bacterium]